jgi:hypothetical protein
MNAHEAYQRTLNNIKRLKGEQLVEVNNAIVNKSNEGKFYCNHKKPLYSEVEGDLITRGFIVDDDPINSNYKRILWDPKMFIK